MRFLIYAMEVMLAGAVGALLARTPKQARLLGVGGAVIGCAIGLAGALLILIRGGDVLSLSLPWAVPYGSFDLQVDGLAAFFLIPIFGLSGLAAIYGGQYLWHYRERKSMGQPWFFYNLLVVSMALVILAGNALLFLIAWELMALSSFFLVTFEDEREAVQRAGWTYLVATHLGTACLFIMFLLMGRAAGSLNFEAFKAIGPAMAPMAGLLFILALVGFGAKAGIMPLHVWLPEAHPAAPSHVSAVMSGAMIKTGIYGIIRVLIWLGPPQAWWAWVLIGIGITSGVGGVLFALAQHDLKRLLAYSSVENIGIIFLGLGLGALGQSERSLGVAVFGYGAALLHVLNHALFKGMLFMGAGGVLQSTHTLDLDQTGGLLKRMPWTGGFFLLGAAAISGLPPLNGFISEFLIYFGGYVGVKSLGFGNSIAALAVIAALALIGGLAVAAFVKAFGIVFLGEPRSPQAANARECGRSMRLAMGALAVCCLLVGLLAPAFAVALIPAISTATGLEVTDLVFNALYPSLVSLSAISAFGLILFAILGGLALLRSRLLAGRDVGATGTWDCGYARPTARMQYTASSFLQPLVEFFGTLLRPKRRMARPKGYFPVRASLATRIPDLFNEWVYCPLFRGIERSLSKLRRLQTGSVHLYILYIAATLIVLLIWKLR